MSSTKIDFADHVFRKTMSLLRYHLAPEDDLELAIRREN